MEGLGSFRSANAKAEVIDISGVPLRVLSYDDLIKNKRAVNRKTDQSDIAELDKIRKADSINSFRLMDKMGSKKKPTCLMAGFNFW